MEENGWPSWRQVWKDIRAEITPEFWVGLIIGAMGMMFGLLIAYAAFGYNLYR